MHTKIYYHFHQFKQKHFRNIYAKYGGCIVYDNRHVFLVIIYAIPGFRRLYRCN